MPLDPSISLQVGKGVPEIQSPLAQFGQYQGIANALEQNKLIQANTQSAQQGVAQQKLQMLMPHLTAIYADPSAANRAYQANLAVRNGTVQPAEAVEFLTGFPNDDSPQTMALVQSRLKPLIMATGSQLQQDTMFGRNEIVNQGQALIPTVRQSPAMGGGMRQAAPAIPLQMSPSELAQRVQTGVDKDGNPIFKPIAAVTPPVLGGQAGAAAAAAVNSPTLGTGRPDNAALLNPQAAPPPQTANPYVTTTQGPKAVASQQATGTSSAEAFNAITKAGQEARGRDSLLSNLQADLEKFTPGKGADAVQALKSTILAVGRRTGIGDFGVDAEKLGGQEAFNKIVNALNVQQGAGSDARLAVSQHANPNANLTKEGLTQILANLRGNEQYIIARAKLADLYPDKTNSRGFENSVRDSLDPRAFQYAETTPAQRRAFLGNFPQKDQLAIVRAYKWAQSQGVLNAGQ